MLECAVTSGTQSRIATAAGTLARLSPREAATPVRLDRDAAGAFAGNRRHSGTVLMDRAHSPHGRPGPENPARTLSVIVTAMLVVYACDSATSPTAADRPTARVPGRAASAVVTAGVTTVCKVGPGATFQVKVGVNAAPQTVAVDGGQCANVATLNPAAQDDVIVSVAENAGAHYALNHIVLQHANDAPRTITGTNTVSFEGAHGAVVTFHNNPVVRVCKVGTAATFQYEVGLGNGFHPLSLADGQCTNIATIPPAPADDVIVTVRENGSTTYRLDHITLGIAALAPTTHTGTNSVSFEGVHGALVTFHNVPITPPASRGCTYTPGYYKNKGSGLLPAGNFYMSGQTWLGVLETPPKDGNAYYILAHHYIAAFVNAKSASTTPAVNTALASAATYFGVANPANWSANGSYSKDQLTGWAGVLGSYNEGKTGPGHCD